MVAFDLSPHLLLLFLVLPQLINTNVEVSTPETLDVTKYSPLSTITINVNETTDSTNTTNATMEPRPVTWSPYVCISTYHMVRPSFRHANKTVAALSHKMVNSTGQLYRVFGMTNSCYIYYGSLHSVYNYWKFRRAKVLADFGMNCTGKTIMLMKSEGISMDILVVMDRVGKRVRVQSATSGEFFADSGDLVWLKLSKDRKEHTFTDPVHKGYVIESFIDVNSRAFVVARNHHRVRIYELRLFVDNDHNLIAYLRDEVMDIDPMLVSPLEGLVGRLVYDLNPVSKNGKEEIDIGSEKNERKETNTQKEDPGDVQCGRPRKKKGRTSGLVFLTREQSLPRKKEVEFHVVAIPISSLLAHSYRGIDPSHSFSNFLFMERQSRFFVYASRRCREVIQSIAVYPHDLPLRNNLNKNEDGKDPFNNCSFRIPSALESGYGITTRKWFNAAQFHRRMSSPHSTLTNRRRNIRAGWIVVAPVLFGTASAMLAASIILSISFRLWDKRSRRIAALSATSTYSVKEKW